MKKEKKEEKMEEDEEESSGEEPEEEESEEAEEEDEEEAPKKKEPSREGGFGERQMFSATCSECGKQTEVPFKPDPDRPVFCRDCYMKKRPRQRRF